MSTIFVLLVLVLFYSWPTMGAIVAELITVIIVYQLKLSRKQKRLLFYFLTLCIIILCGTLQTAASLLRFGYEFSGYNQPLNVSYIIFPGIIWYVEVAIIVCFIAYKSQFVSSKNK